jgi:cyclic beta-1,2-glucan synthetase
MESILGFSRSGNILAVHPCIPRHWPGFKVDYRFGRSHYIVNVENTEGVNRGVRQVFLDGILLPDLRIGLVDDGLEHSVRILMGAEQAK